MINTQYINLNMVPSGVMPVLHCSQYDIGRPLGMVVHNGGESVDLDTYTCTIEATRTDGTPITAAVTTDDNIGAFVTTATMTNQADKYPAKLVLFDSNSRRVASLAFMMVVTEKTMDENAESIEEDASLYQQYTGTVQSLIADIRTDINALEDLTEQHTADIAENADNMLTWSNTNMIQRLSFTVVVSSLLSSGHTAQSLAVDEDYIYLTHNASSTANMKIMKIQRSDYTQVSDVDTGYAIHGNSMTIYDGELYITANSSGSYDEVYVFSCASLAYQRTVTLPVNVYAYAIVDKDGLTTAVAGISNSKCYQISVKLTDGSNKFAPLQLVPVPKFRTIKQDFHVKTYIYQLGARTVGSSDLTQNEIRVYDFDGDLFLRIGIDGIDNSIEVEGISRVSGEETIWLMDVDGNIYLSDSTTGMFPSYIAMDRLKSNYRKPRICTLSHVGYNEADKVTGATSGYFIPQSLIVNPAFAPMIYQDIHPVWFIDGKYCEGQYSVGNGGSNVYITGECINPYQNGDVVRVWVQYYYDSDNSKFTLRNITYQKTTASGETTTSYNVNAIADLLSSNLRLIIMTGIPGQSYLEGVPFTS